MYRTLLQNLDSWRVAPLRKPLLLRGARQVGKTFLLKSWGKSSFPVVHYVNFEKTPTAGRIFDRDFDVRRIVNELAFQVESPINPATDLLILDEIQACPKALTSLKYFCEDLPQLAVACAGSLLGVVLSPESFPVGKVEFLNLYPMSFLEFVKAVDSKDTLKYLPSPSVDAAIPIGVHDQLWSLLRQYYVTGGMPEVVNYFSRQTGKDPFGLYSTFENVRVIQRSIIDAYENDFSKHSGPLNAVHLQALFRNIPSQLATTHDESIKRFHFGDVLPQKKGFASWERPIQWMRNAGLIIQIKIANQSSLPLEHFVKSNLFKLMPHDIGLLGCMQGLSPTALLDQDFGMAKGYFAECYVAQTLTVSGAKDSFEKLYCWQEGESEVEFLYSKTKSIIPVEVKAGIRTKSKSLHQYIKTYEPPLAIRVSRRELSYDPARRLLNLPLPLAHWIVDLSN